MRISRLIILFVLFAPFLNAQQGYFSTQMQIDDAKLNQLIRETIYRSLEERKLTAFSHQLKVPHMRSDVEHILNWMKPGSYKPGSTIGYPLVVTNSGDGFEMSQVIPGKNFFSDNTYTCLFHWDCGKQQGGLFGIAFPVQVQHMRDTISAHICEIYLGELRTALPKAAFDSLADHAQKSLLKQISREPAKRPDHTTRWLHMGGYTDFYFSLAEVSDALIIHALKFRSMPVYENIETMNQQVPYTMGLASKDHERARSIGFYEEWQFDSAKRVAEYKQTPPVYTLDYIQVKRNQKAVGIRLEVNLEFWLSYPEAQKILQHYYPAYLQAFELYDSSDLLERMGWAFERR